MSLLFSCGTEPKPVTETIFNSSAFDQLLDMHCRARMLKDERFKLADQMRMNGTDENLDSLKEIKAKNSRILADSISQVVSKLTFKMTPEEKRSLNDSIEARISMMDCED